MNIDIGGVDANYRTRGEGDCLLLLHGWGVDSRVFDGVRKEFSASYRVIAPDLPGFGESRFRPGAEPNCFAMGDFADGLAALLDELGEPKALICGLSMGGYIAMQFFRRHPDRLSGLIFCDTRSTPDLPAAAEKRL